MSLEERQLDIIRNEARLRELLDKAIGAIDEEINRLDLLYRDLFSRTGQAFTEKWSAIGAIDSALAQLIRTTDSALAQLKNHKKKLEMLKRASQIRTALAQEDLERIRRKGR